MEAAPQSPKADSKLSPRESKTDVQASKRRKLMEKTVLKVKIEANVGNNQKTHEGPPSDFWSWRKYGQKPIKGSPYPRGYYRCSTSKGCSAKKQVERCRTDASMLVITYTSSHNHPGPDLHAAAAQEQDEQQPTSPKSQSTEGEEQEEEQPPTVVFTTNSCGTTDLHKQQEVATGEVQSVHEDHFNYLQSPIQDCLIHLQEADNPLTVVALEEKTHDDSSSLNLLFDEEPPLSYPHLMTFSSSSTTPKSEEYDFYDELEELPTSSSLTSSFMRSTFFDERILVFPS